MSEKILITVSESDDPFKESRYKDYIIRTLDPSLVSRCRACPASILNVGKCRGFRDTEKNIHAIFPVPVSKHKDPNEKSYILGLDELPRTMCGPVAELIKKQENPSV